MSEKKSSTNKKHRIWANILYTDSLPENWKEIVRFSGLKIAISPLHNKDINPDGEQKKEHYHMIMIYQGPVTLENVCSFCVERLKGSMPIYLQGVKGYYRYFTHEDNPEKAQYEKKDIQVFNDFDINDFVEMTYAQKKSVKRELLKIIRDMNFTEYYKFLDYIDLEGTEEQYDILWNNTYVFSTYIKSRRYGRADIEKIKKEILKK